MTDTAKLRLEAAEWFARLRAPDGERHRAAFEQWRRASPAHAVAFAQIEQHWRISAVIADSPMVRTTRLTRAWWSPANLSLPGAAIGGLAAAGLAFALLAVPPAPPRPTGSALATVLGEVRTIRLSDGTRVTLDTESRIKMAFDEHERRIVLEHGRARFAIAPGDPRRFVVAAGDLLVFDKGTVFDVSARSGRIGVMLITGAVEIHGRTPKVLAHPVTLAPGEQISLAADDPGLQIGEPQVAVPDAASWTSGMLSFDAVPLDQVIVEANRYSRTKLILADPQLASYRVTCSFRAAKPEALAASLSTMFGLRRDAGADGAILLRPASQKVRPEEGG